MKDEIIDNLKIKLKKSYLIIVDKIEKNNESTDGNVFIIYSKDRRYVIKLYEDINHIKAMVNLHIYLLSHKINVPKVILTKEQETYTRLSNKYYFVVYSFIEENQIANKYNKLDKSIIRKIAKTLKELHSITSEENQFKLSDLPFDNKDNIKRCSVLHFDLTRSNIFINQNENKITLIDFDDAKYGPSVYDVAITIVNLFFSKTRGVDMEGLNEFINQYYYDELELKNKELSLIKKYALQWIDYTLKNTKLDNSIIESFKVKSKLIEQYL